MKPIEKNNLNSDSAFLVHIIHVSAHLERLKLHLFTVLFPNQKWLVMVRCQIMC